MLSFLFYINPFSPIQSVFHDFFFRRSLSWLFDEFETDEMLLEKRCISDGGKESFLKWSRSFNKPLLLTAESCSRKCWKLRRMMEMHRFTIPSIFMSLRRESFRLTSASILLNELCTNLNRTLAGISAMPWKTKCTSIIQCYRRSSNSIDYLFIFVVLRRIISNIVGHCS